MKETMEVEALEKRKKRKKKKGIEHPKNKPESIGCSTERFRISSFYLLSQADWLAGRQAGMRI